MDVRWRIEMLGGLRAVQGERVLTRFRTQKTGALLAYLAYYPQRAHPRDELIERFWPEADPHAASNSLSQALSSLRQQLEPPGVSAGSVLIANRAAVRFNPEAITTDVAELDTALHAAAAAASDAERQQCLAQAVGLYRGDFLPGYYEPWVLEQREWLAESYFQALGELLTLLEQTDELHRALEYARRGVQLDPLREEARRDLMRLYAALDQPEPALRQYRELEQRLKQELQAEPSAATRALARQIEEGQPPRLVPPSRSTTALPAVEVPTGTVTFLLTDIEGSTRLWEEHPEAMEAVLARHDDLAAGIVAAHDGILVKHRGEGDSLFAVFPRALDAITTACALQRALQTEVWPANLPLRVRMAIHTGDAAVREGDYLGTAVNRCARLRAAAHGGQVLLSAATQELIRDQLPEGVSLRDLGAHRLRDLHQPEHLFQLLHPDLPADFPPLRSLEAFAHNLPAQLTSFIGREREMADVKRLLAASRLLTLTGAGGCGKTRLALHVAADLVEEYPHGAWLVELAALSDPALVPQAVATALGVREEPGRPLTATLNDYLRSRSLLLVLDNCEHLLAACAQLVESLLRVCPKLRMLTSSREGLGVGGEQTYRVASLSLPDPQHLPALDQLQEVEAVRLFAERARLSQPNFAVTSTNATAVAAVCQRLDGIPLAIELAAARVKSLPVETIHARLDDRFRLLSGGSRTALPRQQTLRALIDWSLQPTLRGGADASGSPLGVQRGMDPGRG
jgi:class 3 adenylate cyclase